MVLGEIIVLKNVKLKKKKKEKPSLLTVYLYFSTSTFAMNYLFYF